MVTPMTDEERQRAKERAMANKERSSEAADWRSQSDEVQAAVERGFWLGRSCGGSKAEIDAALAAIRKGVKND